MSVTERLTPSRDRVARETWLAPERLSEPPLRLRYESERVTASFALTLAGVARRKTAAEHLSAGWPVLGAGQGLDAVYQVAAGRLECVLRGHGQADDAAAAVVDARALWRNLDIGLRRGLGDYHFVPSDDSARLESATAFGWRVVLRPLRLRIAARPSFGYLAPAEPETCRCCSRTSVTARICWITAAIPIR